MKVKEIMTARTLKYCSPETKLHNAAKTMKSGNCGALPVVDQQKKVVGLITDRDICLALAEKQSAETAKLEVKKVMTPIVHTVTPDDDITAVLRQMRTNRVGRVPVVNQAGKLQGIVTMHNLLSQTSGTGNVEIGTLTAEGENLLKSMRAITDRYSNGDKRKTR